MTGRLRTELVALALVLVGLATIAVGYALQAMYQAQEAGMGRPDPGIWWPSWIVGGLIIAAGLVYPVWSGRRSSATPLD